jgi:hypothetical protein
MDNLGMRMSPEIWSTIYTGVRGPANGVDSFVRWKFRGIAAPVIVLPKFGVHSVLFIERLFWYLRPLGLWASEFCSNRDITATPVWTTLDAAGERVAVIDPLPMTLVPEALSSGLFAVQRGDRLSAFVSEGRFDYALPASETETPRFMLGEEKARIAAASDILHKFHCDAAIYYSPFLDGLQHLDWPAAARSLEKSAVPAGYEQADRTVAMLIEAFGQPATVMLLSDHGWEYGDYEHFASPMGMYVLAPSQSPGPCGYISACDLEPKMLAIAGVSPRPVARRFLVERTEDEERIKRLRALGYIGR